jgi:hypothetical protein
MRELTIIQLTVKKPQVFALYLEISLFTIYDVVWMDFIIIKKFKIQC